MFEALIGTLLIRPYKWCASAIKKTRYGLPVSINFWTSTWDFGTYYISEQPSIRVLSLHICPVWPEPLLLAHLKSCDKDKGSGKSLGL